MISSVETQGDAVEFDVCGKVGVRLISASTSTARGVEQQLGMAPTQLERDPDIVIRFERLGEEPTLRYAGGDELGFNEDSLFLLRGPREQQVKMRVRLASEDAPCSELVCQPGATKIPLLDELVKATAVAHGLLPMHASAFVYQGLGAVITGFPHGGKTTGMLGFVRQGAQFLSDDTVYVDERRRLHGSAGPVSVSESHVRQLPLLRTAVSPGKRLAMSTAGAMARSMSQWLPRYQTGSGAVSRSLRKIERSLKGRSASVSLADVLPEEAFCTQHSLDRAFLSITHDSDEIRVEKMELDEFARWVVRATLTDMASLIRCYDLSRFAFPQRRCPQLEQLERRLRAAAQAALVDKPLYAVHHPHPVSSAALFEALQSVF